MKRTLLLILVLTAGCARKTDTQAIEDELQNNVSVSLAKRLEGYWLSDSYLTDVARSGSIYESREYQTKFWGFRLEEENLLSDYPTINGFTEHEGGYGCSLKFDSAKSTFTSDPEKVDGFSFIKEPFELRLLTNDRLEIKFADRRDVYRKISNEQVELRRLFEGKFKDLMHDNQEIQFSTDGLIQGLGGHEYFELIFDFGEGINYDAAVFYPHKDSTDLWTKGALFHFKIKGDTLKLFRVEQDWDEMNHEIGALEHLLVK